MVGDEPTTPASTEPPDLTGPPALSPADVLVRGGMSPEIQAAAAALLRLYNENGSPSPIFERRALALGRLCNYLESIMDAAPVTIATHGQLYTRLVEAERRSWDAERVTRQPRPANLGAGDLARAGSVVEGQAYNP